MMCSYFHEDEVYKIAECVVGQQWDPDESTKKEYCKSTNFQNCPRFKTKHGII